MEEGTIWVRRLLFSSMMPSTCSTFSSSVPMIKVVLPASRKPPVVASLVTENFSLVNALWTALESSLFTIANISFTIWPSFNW